MIAFIMTTQKTFIVLVVVILLGGITYLAMPHHNENQSLPTGTSFDEGSQN